MVKICVQYPGRLSPEYTLVEAKSEKPKDIMEAISYYEWALDCVFVDIVNSNLVIHIISKSISGPELKKKLNESDVNEQKREA